jgi:HEAT repeat protein
MARFDCRIQSFVFMVLLFSITMSAHSQTDKQLDSRLQATMAAVRSAKSPNARMDAAEQLADLTHKARPGSVTDSTVADLIDFLDDPSDSVRMFAAAALGNLKAKAAIPKLSALLPTADCLEGPVTSARSIRFALERMGVKPPPAPSYNDCHKPK